MTAISQEDFEKIQKKIISKFGGIDKIIPKYRIIRNPFECPISKITIPELYQRIIQPSRILTISEQMNILGGYDRAKPIVLNEEFKVVDGQHRLLASQMLGYKEIWAVVYEFESFEAEVTYWVWAQKNMAPPGPDQFWHSQYLIDNPYAKLIYKLCKDDISSICKGHVAIKTAKSKKKKITLAVFLQIMNQVGLNFSKTSHWSQANDHLFAKRIKDLGYDQIRDNMNGFFSWFFDIYGKQKFNNAGYDKQVMLAVVQVYIKMTENKLLKGKKNYNYSIRKLQRFDYNISKINKFKIDDYVTKMVNDIDSNRSKQYRIEK
jgi:hypothetical protein